MHSEITRVENSALEPTFPVAPQKKLIVLIAAVLGGLVALFLAFFLEYLEKMKEKERTSS